MENFNICVLGYNSKYKKFLRHIKDKKTKYELIFIDKSKNIKNLNSRIIKKKIIKEKVKFLALCNKDFIPFISENISFFIKNKVKIVQASNNFEVSNHGFIIEKPFKDYSFEELFLRKTLKINDKNIKAIFKNKKILITGGAGSIGSGLVEKLLKLNVKKIYVIDNSEYNIFKLKESINNNASINKVEFSLTNIENSNLLNSDFIRIKPDIVFNAAALKHVAFLENNAKQGLATNVLGTYNVISAASKNNTKYFIHISTDKAADPKNVLGYTKLISEFICNNFKKTKMKVGIVRFGNVFNSYGSVSETFKSKILKAQKIKLSHPNVERYFMSILEATNLIISSVELISEKKNSCICRTFICDMDKPIRIKDLATKMLYLSGRNPSQHISKSYYGLIQNMEKITEKLISKKENIININKNGVIEITGKYKNINLNKINKIIYSNFDNQKIKKRIKFLI